MTRTLPDTLWLAEAIDSLGKIAAAVKGKGDLLPALRTHADLMRAWEVDAANAAQTALLSPEASARIMAEIYRQIEETV